MSIMTSQFLKFVDFTKIQKSRYLENETLFFLQIKKFINYTSRTTLWQKNTFVAEVTFNCESVGYWYIVVCQNQLTIFVTTRSTIIADYSGINYLIQALVFLAKIGILSIVSRSKSQNWIFLDYFLLTHHMKRYLIGLFIWHIDIT